MHIRTVNAHTDTCIPYYKLCMKCSLLYFIYKDPNPVLYSQQMLTWHMKDWNSVWAVGSFISRRQVSANRLTDSVSLYSILSFSSNPDGGIVFLPVQNCKSFASLSDPPSTKEKTYVILYLHYFVKKMCLKWI